MRSAWLVGLHLGLAASVSGGNAGAAAEPAARAPADTALILHVEVGSRLYPTWHEQLGLRLGERFYLGDSEYTARIERFLPDFRLVDGKFLSLTQKLANPAAQVIVYHDTTATDTCWAFLKFPPHFSPRSFFTFKLLGIQGWVPGAADSLAAALAESLATTAADSVEASPKGKPIGGAREKKPERPEGARLPKEGEP